MKGLPPSWSEPTLSEIVADPRSDIVDGPFGSNLKATEYQDRGVPIIRLQNVDRNRFIDKNIRYVSLSKADELERHSFIAGDIAVTKLGEPLGKAAIIPSSFPRGVIVADIVRIRLDPAVADPRYITYALNSPQVIEQLARHTKGTTRPRVNLGHIRSLRIPLAPRSEQTRIADKLDRLLAAVDTCKARLDAIPAILKRFRQSVLAAAVSGELTEEWRRQMGCTERWQTYSLKDLCSRVSVGHVGETSKYYTTRDEGGIPFLRSQNVRPGRISLEGLNYITKEFHAQLKKSQLHAGDLLVVRVGANRGDACVLPPGFGEINCANIVFARPKAILPQYLNVFVQSPTCRDDLIGRTVGGAQGVINTRSVEMIQIKVPSEAEQIEIVRRVDELLAYCERVQATTAAVRVRVDILVQALLSKAFRGQLGEVPTEKQNTAGDRSLIYVDHEGRMLLGV